MLSQYRALLVRARARRLLLGCLLGWLAFTSYALAIILAVHAATGSFRAAGGAVAAFSAGSGLLAPARGRFIDTHGAHALAVFALTHAGAAAGLIAACGLHSPAVILVVIAAVAGMLAPPLIATARMLWADIAGPQLARPAHALNASLADVAQLLSPGLTGGLAALVAAAFGGIVASLSMGSRSASPPAAARYVRGSLIVAAALPLMLVHPSLAAVTAVALVAGAGYGCLGAALFELLDHVVSTDRAVEAFTWLTTGQAAGMAAGAAVAGVLTQRASTGGFILVAICGAGAALITVLRRDSLRTTV